MVNPKTVNTRLFCFFLCLLIIAPLSVIAQITFERHIIATTGTNPYHFKLADINGDGDLDIVVTVRAASQIIWYENPANPALDSWPATQIGSLTQACHVCVVDVDKDGKLDVVVSNYDQGKVYWYKQPADPHSSPWDVYPIETVDLGSVRGLDVGDIDKDGNIDILVDNCLTVGAIYWYEGPDNPLSGTWTQHTIASNINGSWDTILTDIDGDGSLDVIAAIHNENTVSLFKGSGDSWTRYDIASQGNAMSLVMADIDKDGKNDVVCCSNGADGLRWYKTPADPTSVPWSGYVVSATPRRWGDAGDIDLDGDLDLVFPYFDGDEVYWFEALADPTGSWNAHLIDSGTDIDGPIDLKIGDIDDDGDLDIVGVGYMVGNLWWLENKGTPTAVVDENWILYF